MSWLVQKAARKVFAQNLEAYRPEDPLYEEYQDDRGNVKRRKRAIPPGLSKRDAAILRSVQKRAHYLDKSFSLCGFRYGWSFWVGLIPVVGDVVVAGMNYILVIRKAQQAELPPWLLAQMMTHLSIGVGVGLVPIVGDLVVAVYKPNSRNAALLHELLRVRGEQLLALEGKEPDGTTVKKGSMWRGKKRSSPPVTEHDAEQIKPGAGMSNSGVASPEYTSSSDEKSPNRLLPGSSSKKAY